MIPKPLRWFIFLGWMTLAFAALGANTYRFLLSLKPDRSAGPYDITTFTISTKVYPYIDPPAGIQSVQFYLDDADLDQPFCTERLAPFDCMGTATDNTARPLDLATLAPGVHTLTARITQIGGNVQTLQARIEIPYPSATPVPTISPTPVPTPAGKVKWHPGNYLNAYWGTAIDYHVGLAKASPYLQGVSVVHGWWTLEKAKGVYDFAAIEAELKVAAAAGKRLIIQVADRSFKGQDCTPAYVRSDPLYQGGQTIARTSAGAFKACTARRWSPAVQDRLIALYQALGKRFDAEPYFEAVMMEEDSLDRTGSNMAGYSDRTYIDQSKRGMTALAEAFPHTVVFKGLNWGPGIPELFAHAQAVGLGVSGPDLDPKSPTWAYPAQYQAYAGRIPLELSVQDPRVVQTITAGTTVGALYDYGVSPPPNGLGLNYIVWDQSFKPQINYNRDILPTIVARQGVTQTACPESLMKLRGGCAR